MMRISVALLASVMTIGQAIAAPVARIPSPDPNAAVARQAPLPAGGAASIREAQGIGRPLLYWAAAGGLVIAGVLLLNDSGDDGDSSTTTTTTGTGS